VTQRKWTTEDGWSVVTGWDRPLQYFFVSIDRECGGCDGEGIITDGFGGTEDDPRDCNTCDGTGTEYLFNNLDDKSGQTDARGGMTIEQVMVVLADKLTDMPPDIFNRLYADKAHDVGNDTTDYGTIGEEKDDSIDGSS